MLELACRSLIGRAVHSDTWQQFALKGQGYYNAWKAKNGDDVDDPCGIDDFFLLDAPEKAKKLSGITKALLRDNGYNIDSTFYSLVATGPKGAAILDFAITIGPSAGAFRTSAADRGATKSGGPIPYQHSDVAWWMWKRAVLTENKDATDFSGIQTHWHRDIDNPESETILNEIFAGKDVTQRFDFTPGDESLDNPFWPLLGSANGNGIQYFLTDHKKATKGKVITKFSVTTIEARYQMWATIG